MKKIVSSLILIIFLLNGVMPPAVAEVVFMPPAQGTVGLSPAFTPCQLRGVKIDPQDPFRLDFIVEEGDSGLTGQAFEDESQKLIKYFLATLTTPENDLWVNLSPYEDNRIIQDDFGRTAMGRDLLAQDYVLKQITASLMHPDADLGKKFWDEVYKRTFEKYGTTDIPVDTFNKVWIVPERAVIYESSDVGRQTSNGPLSAYVDETRLKVMLESDYVALERGQEGKEAMRQSDASLSLRPLASTEQTQVANPTQELARNIVREVIIPVLEKEVNEGRNFAELRQVFHSLLLAVWLKKKLQSAAPPEPVAEKPGIMKGNLLSLIFVNQHKTGGLETADPKAEVRSIYDRYFEAFKKGAYNIIREDYDIYSQELIPRKYFSGGFSFGNVDAAMSIRHGKPDMSRRGFFQCFEVRLEPQGAPTGFFIEENRKKKTKTYYFQTTRRKAVLAIMTALGGSFAAGYLKGRFFSQDTAEPQLNGPERQAGMAPQRPQVLDAGTMEKVLDEVTTGIQYYQTGNSDQNRRRRVMRQLLGQGRKLNAKISAEEALQRLSNGDAKMSFEKLAQIMNKASNDFAKGLTEAGLSSYDQARLLIGIFGRESEFDMSKSQLIGKKRKVTQARGGGQFEARPFKELLGIAQAILGEKTAQGLDFQQFLNQVDEEFEKKGLWDLKNNRWTSADPNDLVVQSEAHIRLAYIWLNHLATSQPTPWMTEMQRLDKRWISGITSWQNQELTLLEFWEQARKRYPVQMHKIVLMLLLSAQWQGGKNLTARQFAEILKYVFGNNRQREQYLLDAGKEVREQGKAMSDSKSPARQVRKLVEKYLGSRGCAQLFSQSPGVRQNALINLNNKLQGEQLREFGNVWAKYRVLEDALYFAGWKLKNCRMAALYADIVWSYWNAHADPEKAYQLGLVFTDERAAHQEELSKDDAQRTDQASSYGGIDLQTGGMDLDIRGNAGAFEIEIPTDTLERLRNDVKGFVPLIINVQPLTDVPLFLGLSDSSSNSS